MDVPAAAALRNRPPEKSYSVVLPVGRSALGKDHTGAAIPYLHTEDCGCGGRWCAPLATPLAPLEEPVAQRKTARRAKPAAPDTALLAKPKPWRLRPWQLLLAAAVVFAAVRFMTVREPESPLQRMQREYLASTQSLRAGIPSLHSVLSPIFHRDRV
jgi:hypothetical protein